MFKRPLSIILGITLIFTGFFFTSRVGASTNLSVVCTRNNSTSVYCSGRKRTLNQIGNSDQWGILENTQYAYSGTLCGEYRNNLNDKTTQSCEPAIILHAENGAEMSIGGMSQEAVDQAVSDFNAFVNSNEQAHEVNIQNPGSDVLPVIAGFFFFSGFILVLTSFVGQNTSNKVKRKTTR